LEVGSINLGFILREDLLLCSSYLPLGVPNWAVIYTPSANRLVRAKEALIKSVAQALTIYAMSVFKLSVGFHEDHAKMIRTFWWGEEEKKEESPLCIMGFTN
jgi:hypothetical protein